MRNKLLILSVFIGCYFLLWLKSNQLSSVDKQFNLDRILLGEKAPETIIFPAQVGNFRRKSLDTSKLYDLDQQQGYASYIDPEGRKIYFAAKVNNLKPKDLINSFQTMRCGEIVGNVTLHADINHPYRYATCVDGNFAEYNFTWVNNDWILTASAGSPISSNAEALLQFVNEYPH